MVSVVVLRYSANTFMIAWVFKMLGATVAVWMIGSIGGVRTSFMGILQYVAVVVAFFGLYMRVPLWNPQFAAFVRIAIIIMYFFNRVVPTHDKRTTVFRRNKEGKVLTDGHTRGDLKKTVRNAVLLQLGFLLLAGISYINNTIITCA